MSELNTTTCEKCGGVLIRQEGTDYYKCSNCQVVWMIGTIPNPYPPPRPVWVGILKK